RRASSPCARKAAGGASPPRCSPAGRVGTAMAADKGRRRGRGAIETVTSIHNPAVKEIRALALRKYREASGLFLAEGLKLVQDAIEEGWSPRTLMMASGLAAQTRAGEAAAAV